MISALSLNVLLFGFTTLAIYKLNKEQQKMKGALFKYTKREELTDEEKKAKEYAEQLLEVLSYSGGKHGNKD